MISSAWTRISIVIVLFAASLLMTPPLHAAQEAGTLIKLACPNAAKADDPCRSVYYYGSDERRHAFPNEKTYFTWYTDFSNVQVVTAEFMASLPLGSNVTYRPGSNMIKITSVNKVYAVELGGTIRWVTTEQAAEALYGANWNTHIDDVSDALFADYRASANITSAADFEPSAERDAAPTIDANLDTTHRQISVATERGTFSVNVVTLHKNRYAMITATGNASDCENGCVTKSLAAYAEENNASIGIHGTYFCPPEYPECAGKTNSFLWPMFNSAAGTLVNASNIPRHEGPMLASATDGQYLYFHRAKDFGSSVAAFEATHQATLEGAVAHVPSLLENGVLVVEQEPRLDDSQRTIKATRGGIGMNDRFIYLIVAQNATVVDLASIMNALGAQDAMNLDGGGSTALLYNNAYKIGPGRALPNALLFKKR